MVVFPAGTIALTLLKRCCNSSSSIFYLLHPYAFSNPPIITPGGTGKTLSILRKRCFTCKIRTRRGLGSGGAAKCHIPTPAGLGRALGNSRDKGSSGGTQISAGTQLSHPAHADSSLKAEAATQAPNEGSCRSSNYLCNQLTASLPAPFMAFYCPAGTKTRK